MEKDFFWKESQSIPELKKAAKAHKAKLAQALADFEQERAALAGQLDRAARELQAAEKDKAELGAEEVRNHFHRSCSGSTAGVQVMVSIYRFETYKLSKVY